MRQLWLLGAACRRAHDQPLRVALLSAPVHAHHGQHLQRCTPPEHRLPCRFPCGHARGQAALPAASAAGGRGQPAVQSGASPGSLDEAALCADMFLWSAAESCCECFGCDAAFSTDFGACCRKPCNNSLLACCCRPTEWLRTLPRGSPRRRWLAQQMALAPPGLHEVLACSNSGLSVYWHTVGLQALACAAAERLAVTAGASACQPSALEHDHPMCRLCTVGSQPS